MYSTCSLNPIEDEAVVAGLMTKYKGYIRYYSRCLSPQRSSEVAFLKLAVVLIVDY